MEKYINNDPISGEKGDFKMGDKVLIATLYSADPVIFASTRLGPDRLVLLIDKIPNAEQQKSLKLIKDSLGKVIDVKTVKTDVYDIVEVATECVKVIDNQPRDDIIYVNITSGRKTKAIGLLFAAYARHDQVKKIAYNPEDSKSVVYLPRLSFKLTESQKKILDYLDQYTNMADFAKIIGLSTAMLYRAIDELKDMDLITSEDGYKLTDAGKIARL